MMSFLPLAFVLKCSIFDLFNVCLTKFLISTSPTAILLSLFRIAVGNPLICFFSSLFISSAFLTVIFNNFDFLHSLINGLIF